MRLSPRAHPDAGFTDPYDLPARRAATPGAILGNGSLLVTLSRTGEVERLFWPHVDRDQLVGLLRLGLRRDGAVHWLDEAGTARQRYEDDAMVLVTTLECDGVEVELVDTVLADADVLLRRVRCSEPVELVAYLRPEFDGTSRHAAGYVDPHSGTLVTYRRRRALALRADGPTTAVVGERQRLAGVAGGLSQGRVEGDTVSHGPTDAAVLAGPAEELVLHVALAEDPADAVALAGRTSERPASALLDRRREHDAARLEDLAPAGADAFSALYRRSLLVLDLVTDRATGGTIAGPEIDDDFVRCGGYGYVWGRDLAFIVLGLLAADRHDEVRRALQWVRMAQDPDGIWAQRHWTDGTLAPAWGTQIDETGAILFAYHAAVEQLGDPMLAEDLWPSAQLGADALLRDWIDPTTRLPRPSMDLWEERRGLHAYTAAATAAGLRGAAAIARLVGEDADGERYDATAADIVSAIEQHLWSEQHGRYLRSIWVGRDDLDGEPLPDAYDPDRRDAERRVRTADPVDPTVDVSVLGLAYPFGVVPADAPRMAATVDAVAEALTVGDGGLLRYTDDDYVGGNPWVLTTLWLGLVRRQQGRAEDAAERFAYALTAATPTELLPEQVDEATGDPRWVLPLTWSHAMLLLAVRPDVVDGLLPTEAEVGS